MEENKNFTPETQENFDIAEAVKADKKEKKAKAPKKEKLIKNQAFFKKGSYSIAITAIVLAAVIAFNILIGVLAERFVLEFDMTAEKQNSISEENIEYIKDIEKEITVTVCAAEESYSSYMGYYASSYGVTEEASAQAYGYFEQTVGLVNKYNAYNDKIKVNFVDTQSTAFYSVTSKFSNENLAYGDIIVSLEKEDGSTRYKKIGFNDIYVLDEDETYAAYGMTMATVAGNNVETALTSAIAYVLSDIEKKVAVFTGHSPTDYTEEYREMLKNNNFDVTVLEDSALTEISDEYDAIVIPGPTKDFTEREIGVLSEFLDNDGNLNKGMMVFVDTAAPYLKNFYDFLSEWGADIDDGILFETNQDNYMPDLPTALGSYNSGAIEELADMEICVTDNNVPMKLAFEKQDYMMLGSIMETHETVVAAPKGIGADWTGASKYKPDVYSTVIECIKSNYDADDNEIESHVSVFSSVDFLSSEYNEYSSFANKNITLALAERAVGADDFGISFVSKEITNESFASTQSASTTMRIIFILLLPLAMVAVSVVVYIKRRNAE